MFYGYVTKIKSKESNLRKNAIHLAIQLRELGLKISKDNPYLTAASKILNYKNWEDVDPLCNQIKSILNNLQPINNKQRILMYKGTEVVHGALNFNLRSFKMLKLSSDCLGVTNLNQYVFRTENGDNLCCDMPMLRKIHKRLKVNNASGLYDHQIEIIEDLWQTN